MRGINPNSSVDVDKYFAVSVGCLYKYRCTGYSISIVPGGLLVTLKIVRFKLQVLKEKLTIVEYSANSVYFVSDPSADVSQESAVERKPVGRHEIWPLGLATQTFLKREIIPTIRSHSP